MSPSDTSSDDNSFKFGVLLLPRRTNIDFCCIQKFALDLFHNNKKAKPFKSSLSSYKTRTSQKHQNSQNRHPRSIRFDQLIRRSAFNKAQTKFCLVRSPGVKENKHKIRKISHTQSEGFEIVGAFFSEDAPSSVQKKHEKKP